MQNRMRTAQQRTTRTDTPVNRDTESWAGRRRARSGDTGEERCVTTKEGVSRVRPAQRRNTHRRNPPSWKSRRRPRAPFRQFKRKAKGFDKMQHPLVMKSRAGEKSRLGEHIPNRPWTAPSVLAQRPPEPEHAEAAAVTPPRRPGGPHHPKPRSRG